MNKAFYDNLVAFVFGDISAMVALTIFKIDWLLSIEAVATKLFIIIASGLIGGAAGVVGKHFMQKFLNKHFHIIIGCCLMAVAMGGCKTQHTAGVVRTANTETKDSTSVRIVERFVPVEVPGDTVEFFYYVECPDVYSVNESSPLPPPKGEKTAPKIPKPFKQKLQGKRSDGVIELDAYGKLTAAFNCNHWRDSVKVKDTEIARLKSVSKTENTVKTVEVRYIPKAYKWAMWFSWIVIALVVGRIALKVAVNYFKIQIPFISWLIK